LGVSSQQKDIYTPKLTFLVMTTAITLRKVQQKDAPLLVQWVNDRQNIQYMSTLIRCKKHTLQSIQQEIRQADPSYERLFMVLCKGKRQPIGHAGIDDIDTHDRRAEIFFLIGDKEEQGKGYSKDILMKLLDYAFTKMRLNSLFATATIRNIPSQKALERAGFKRIGIRREYNNIGGKFMDEILYDMTAKEYRKKNAFR